MDLWIRSQDKEKLVKAKEFTIEVEEYGSVVIWNWDINLGTYSSYERALEILNEIEEKIMIINTASLVKDSSGLRGFKEVFGEDKLQGLSYPYQMPEK